MYNINEHVHLSFAEGEKVRKKDDTLREKLLLAARRLASEEGINAISIRSLANKAGIATGTVYNYFKNKDEILLALTEAYWTEALAEISQEAQVLPFPEQVRKIYAFLQQRMRQDAGQLMGSLSGVEALGQQRMTAMQGKLRLILQHSLEQDPNLRDGLWSADFSPERFADFVLVHMLALLRAPYDDSEDEDSLGFLLEILARILY